MLWHTGDVFDAVNKVKDLRKRLFVFIRDEDTCGKYIEMIEKSSKLHEILRNSISLNLVKESAEYRQFAEVYAVEETPSIYVITHDGRVVTIINGVMGEEALCDTLREIFDTFYYFAFGSNLLKERIQLKNPSARFLTTGALKNYELSFCSLRDKKVSTPYSWEGGTASIIPKESGVVYGAVWEMSNTNLDSLDKQESVPHIYQPFEVEIELKSGELVKCRCYRMSNGETKKPSPYYLDIVLRGACQCQLPEFYIEKIRSIEHDGYLGECPLYWTVLNSNQSINISDFQLDILRNKKCVNLEISNESKLASNINESTNVAEETITHEDKMVEVRRLLAEKQKQKAEIDKQKEIEDELNRRELGRQLHQLKKTQKEREEEDIKAEIKRQRNEEKEARNKILRQIEEDKLERRQRFNNQSPSIPNNQPEETQLINRSCANGSEVRLQFRFPDGSSINHKFQNEDKFAFVRKFVSEYIRNTMGSHENFEIKQFFPRRTISTEDDDDSLVKLQLVPSASFAVSFISRPVNSNQTSVSNWLISPINFIYLSLLSVLQWIKLKLGIKPQNPPNEPSSSTASNWEERQRRLLATESRTIKKDGNLAGFKDSYKKIDDDEDEARWNGNSTQQM